MLVYNIPALIWNNTINTSVGKIFMLHRVADYDKLALGVNEDLKISPDDLEKIIISLKDKYNFISINNLSELNNTKINKIKKFLIFTIDDGYKDSYTAAYQIFKKYNIPFTVFVSTDYIDNNAPFLWWYKLEEIIMDNDSLNLDEVGDYKCVTKEEKNKTFKKLRSIVLSFPYSTFKSDFFNLFRNYTTERDFEKYSGMMMSWDDIKDMDKDPLCVIGGHTVSHIRLSKHNLDDMLYEIKGCKSKIEDELGHPINSFSYPFGSKDDVTDVVKNVVKDAGFQSAYISYGGDVRRYSKDLYMLPRIELKQL